MFRAQASGDLQELKSRRCHGAEETEAKVSGHLRSNGRAKRFDQDEEISLHRKESKLRVAAESISEAVVAMFAASGWKCYRLHKA